MIGLIIVASIALLAGLLLSVSSIVFATPKDEKVEALAEALPGINCGACGYSGCEAYAVALAKKETQNGLCPPGGAEVVADIAEILGEAAGAIEKKIAVLKCQGHTGNTSAKMEYQGYDTCQAASLIYGGDGTCQYSCLGKGDCQVACPEDAIEIVDGLAVVNASLCTGCSICAKTCPKNVIDILPEKFIQHVGCKNTDKGAQTRKVCKTGCIGCMRCKKVCEFDAITVENFLATIDYDKCTNCGSCVEACPVDAIYCPLSEIV